jgi:RNA polymerase sigma-70 factor (ECF subfamily)
MNFCGVLSAEVRLETTQTHLLWAVRDSRDSEAWASFYRIYATMVTGFVRRMGLPDADAEDVTQEVLLIAHKSLRDGVYDPAKGRFRLWLFGIARRQSLARFRERRRRTRAQWVTEDGTDLIDRLEDRDSDENAMALWLQEWRYALLEEALRHIQTRTSEKEFKAFVLYGLERKPVDEVAAELGVTTSSVYVYKHRVLGALREWVGQFEQDE